MRHIQPEMFNLILKKLEHNGEAQENMRLKKDPRRLLVIAAPLFVGVREKTGHNDGPIIELIQKTIGGAYREPYCLAFAQTLIAFVEKVYGIESPIHPTEHCMTCWRNSPKHSRVLFSPDPGAITIYNHQGTDSGHAAIFIESITERKEKFAHNVEANTTGGVDPYGAIVREGGGIYWTKRPWQRNVGGMLFVGHLKPF